MKTKSMWGDPPSRLYKFKRLVKSRFGKKAVICVIGASDGKFVLPFLRDGFTVTAYELDETAIYGGRKEFPINRSHIPRLNYAKNPNRNPEYQKVPSEMRDIIGLKKRAELEGYAEQLTIRIENFYKAPPTALFDGVFTSCSIPYPCNYDIPVIDIVHQLMSSVSDGGYLYMDYMMPLEDCHSWRPEHYIRKGKIREYFDCSGWRILHLYEMTKPVFEAAHVDRPEDHFHRFGYILAEHN